MPLPPPAAAAPRALRCAMGGRCTREAAGVDSIDWLDVNLARRAVHLLFASAFSLVRALGVLTPSLSKL